jgi:hypothetical protein
MGWLNNVWVVGIGTGILSGLVTYWLLNLIQVKKKDREYRQQMASANREVIYSIRAGIPENSLPTRAVIEALIHSTARRYEVQAVELYQPFEIVEELVKEVMDSSFVSSTKKVEYCAVLIPLGKDVPMLDTVRPDSREAIILETRNEMLQEKIRKTSRIESLTTIMIGLITALATGAAATMSLLPNVEHFFRSLGKPAVLVIAVPFFALILTCVVMRFFQIWSRQSYSTQQRDLFPKNDKDLIVNRSE